MSAVPARPPGAWASRLYLFVPATRLDRVDRAWEAGADEVIVDLEDAVAEEARPAARAAVGATAFARPVHVRVNGVGTPDHAEDLAALAEVEGLRGVVVPKAEDPEGLEDVAAALPDGAELVALVETPRGVLRAPELAASGLATRLALGPVDLAAAVGVDRTEAFLAHPRAVLALASSAAGLPPAVDGPHTALDDEAGLAADAAAGAALGLAAKLCIHPRQLAVVARVLAPAPAVVERARALLAAAEGATGAFRWDGEMVDEPVLARARAVVAAADRCGA